MLLLVQKFRMYVFLLWSVNKIIKGLLRIINHSVGITIKHSVVLSRVCYCQCLQISAESWEQSVLSKRSQVSSAYPAMCGIQREAKK